jgi:hypothetical protein
MRNVFHDSYEMDIYTDPGQGVGNLVENVSIYDSQTLHHQQRNKKNIYHI